MNSDFYKAKELITVFLTLKEKYCRNESRIVGTSCESETRGKEKSVIPFVTSLFSL